MGIDVRRMIYIGKWVEDAEQYLIEKGLLKEGELEDKYDGDIGYMPDCPLEVQGVSYYADEGYYVGFQVNINDYLKYPGLLEKLSHNPLVHFALLFPSFF